MRGRYCHCRSSIEAPFLDLFGTRHERPHSYTRSTTRCGLDRLQKVLTSLLEFPPCLLLFFSCFSFSLSPVTLDTKTRAYHLLLKMSYPPLDQRPLKDTICLFDVDETLTPARKVSLLSILFRLHVSWTYKRSSWGRKRWLLMQLGSPSSACDCSQQCYLPVPRNRRRKMLTTPPNSGSRPRCWTSSPASAKSAPSATWAGRT